MTEQSWQGNEALLVADSLQAQRKLQSRVVDLSGFSIAASEGTEAETTIFKRR